MSRYIAPATISSERDLVEYHVATAEPVDPAAPKGYSERCIHSEALRRFPAVNAVIHSHSPEVVPYAVSGVPLRAAFHMGGFLGVGVPVWDIAGVYAEGDRRDMLVRNTRLGASLAECFGPEGTEPAVVVALMRGHGFTVVGPSVVDAVLRAVYTQLNARVQTTALVTRAAHFGARAAGGAEGEDGVHYLSEAEAGDASEMTRWSAMRPWRLWLREVEACGLYVNGVVTT